jgi:hypothetical protein
MADLTKLESKLAEVLGLAQAAQGATDKVAKLVEEDDEEIAQTLRRMHEEAAETERRATEVAGEIDGKKTAILEKARETKGEATEMMSTYLGGDAEGLDGLEFLVMAEILGKLNERAGVADVRELVDWALPIQQRHFEQARECSLQLAGEEDPNEVE